MRQAAGVCGTPLPHHARRAAGSNRRDVLAPTVAQRAAGLPPFRLAIAAQLFSPDRQRLTTASRLHCTQLGAAKTMPTRTSKTGKSGKKLPTAYSKADAFGGSKYEVSHIVGKGAYGVVW